MPLDQYQIILLGSRGIMCNKTKECQRSSPQMTSRNCSSWKLCFFEVPTQLYCCARLFVNAFTIMRHTVFVKSPPPYTEKYWILQTTIRRSAAQCTHGFPKFFKLSQYSSLVLFTVTAKESNLHTEDQLAWAEANYLPVSYTHLTLPTKRIV